MKFLVFLFYILLCTSFLWVPMALFMWWMSTFPECSSNMTMQC